MKATVLKDVCIGCGLCPDMEPEIFTMADDGKAVAIMRDLTEGEIDRAKDAASSCPVEAIEVK